MADGINEIVGVLLAGGQSRRMGGGDKCLQPLGNVPVLSRVLSRARPQVSKIILNANGDPARFGSFSLSIVADSIDGFAGPLAGVLAGLDWAARQTPKPSWLASFATDAPFIPEDLVAQLHAAIQREDADMACARSGGQIHPVFALWPLELADDLRRALVEEHLRKVDLWMARYRVAIVGFPIIPIDPFMNLNRPEDFAKAEQAINADRSVLRQP